MYWRKETVTTAEKTTLFGGRAAENNKFAFFSLFTYPVLYTSVLCIKEKTYGCSPSHSLEDTLKKKIKLSLIVASKINCGLILKIQGISEVDF